MSTFVYGSLPHVTTISHTQNMNERLRTFINYLVDQRRVFNIRDFGDHIGKNKSQMSNLLNGKTIISTRAADKIKKAFPELNLEWLMTGEGEMILNVAPAAAPEPFASDFPTENMSFLEEQFTEVCQENTQLKIENSRLRQKIFSLMERLSRNGFPCNDDTI